MNIRHIGGKGNLQDNNFIHPPTKLEVRKAHATLKGAVINFRKSQITGSFDEGKGVQKSRNHFSLEKAMGLPSQFQI